MCKRALFTAVLILSLFSCVSSYAGLGKPLCADSMSRKRREAFIEDITGVDAFEELLKPGKRDILRKVLERLPDSELEILEDHRSSLPAGGLNKKGKHFLTLGIGLLVITGVLLYLLVNSAGHPGDALGVAWGGFLIGAIFGIPAIMFLLAALGYAIFGKPDNIPPEF